MLLSSLRRLFDTLDTGVLLVSPDARIALANQVMATTIGKSIEDLEGHTADELSDHICTMVDDAPPLVLERRLLGRGPRLVCEEFEIVRPQRSVVRWVARPIEGVPGVDLMVQCTDITVEVDLSAAHERLALTDRLTGLMNRRGMEATLRREVARSHRTGAPLSVVLCDVDHFKHINDVHGHGAGDDVLQRLGRCLSSVVRASDAVARWGGEEFMALLPGEDVASARVVAERLRAAVEALTPPSGRVTLSAGVAALGATESPGDAIARADRQLYAAKHAGRNRVC